MSFLKSFNPKHIQLSVFLAATLFYQGISATELGLQFTGIADGSTVTISLDPPLPRKGEPFTIEVSGTWANTCIAKLADLEVDLDGLDGNYQRDDGIEQFIKVRANTFYGCEDEYEPTPFTRSAVIPGSAWEQIDEKKPLLVWFSMWGMVTPHNWTREFDLSWGLHEIPPQIGSGHWISDQRPFQGLNIEQQGDTVLVYKLDYSRYDGRPSWLMGNARFHGDVTHGVLHDVRWLNPKREIDPETHDRVQPKEDEMSFIRSLFGIDVEGINQVHVKFSANSSAQTYKRYVFRSADNQLPVVIPDMAGQWNLYAFDNQNLEASFLIEFRAATKSDKGLGWYRFKSLDDQWVLDCWTNLDGVGTCILTNEDLGITMSYDLVDFNGNYAKVPLVHSNVEEATQTGILLRAGFRLPVLDIQ